MMWTGASALFCASARTVIEEALLKAPPTSALVCPDTTAMRTRMVTFRPPIEICGNTWVVSAVLVPVAWISTAPDVETLPVEAMVASVERPLSARATVRPTAMPPTLMLRVWVCTEWTPSAWTVTPPEPTVPWAPELADPVPFRSAKASAPLIATRPPPTAVDRMSELTLSSTVTNRCETDPPAPSATSPMLAVASPSTEVTATAAPVAKTPPATAMSKALSVRCAIALTSMPPPALVIPAPVVLVSMWAFCVPVSLTTATMAPTATNPAVPAKPIAVELSCMSALTLTWPSAVTLDRDKMPASVLLETLRTSTEAPTPTRPAPIEPATPTTLRLSVAHTRTCPPVMTVASM